MWKENLAAYQKLLGERCSLIKINPRPHAKIQTLLSEIKNRPKIQHKKITLSALQISYVLYMYHGLHSLGINEQEFSVEAVP